MDLSNYSTEELKKIAGITPQKELSDYSTEELYKIAGIEKSPLLSKEEISDRARKMMPQLYNEDGSIKGDWVESNFIRKPVAVMKGVANASLNPAGIITKSLNYLVGNGKYELPESMQGFKSKDFAERSLERGSEQANNFYALMGLGNALGGAGALGSGVSLPSKTARFLLTGSPARAAVGGFGGGALSGGVNSKNPYIDTALNVVGATLGDIGLSGAKGLISGIKSIGKQKPASSTTYAESVVNPDKYTAIKKGIQSGDKGLREQALSLNAGLKERAEIVKRGYRPEDVGLKELEEQITLPKMRVAKKNYDVYMKKYGDTLLPQKDVSRFYNENPVAKDLIENAREINPVKWSSIKRGSIREADELKKMLAKAKGTTGDVSGLPLKEAAETANNSIKDLMEKAGAGFRQVNKDFAKASTEQNLFIKKLSTNASNLANVQPSQFMSGLSSPITGAGVVGGFFNPISWALTGGMLGAKAGWRALNRQGGRAAARGVSGITEMIKNATLNSMKHGAKSGVYGNLTRGEE